MISQKIVGSGCDAFPIQQVETAQYKSAMSIVNKLKNSGFSAYFAGGWVRDILVEKENDDIDIVTNAPLKEIQRLFTKTSDKGLDYGVVFVEFGGEVFEIATFRKDGEYTNGRSPNSVETGSMEDDAWRRDFTVNALYYDPIEQRVFDYTDGVSDIDGRLIRSVGDPFTRLEEDLLRILRAIRFSTKLEFDIEDQTMQAIKELAPKIFPSLSKQKAWNELKKMSYYPNFGEGLIKMYDTGVLQVIFPSLQETSKAEVLKAIVKINTLPQQAPTIIKILQLFPNITKKEAMDMCLYLNLTKREGSQIIKDYYQVRELIENPEAATDHDWAMAYAKYNMNLFIPASNENKERFNRLDPYIQRIQSGNPIITSKILQQEGLNPSKIRGNFNKLLIEAEKISINQRLTNVDEILSELKKSKLWPNN